MFNRAAVIDRNFTQFCQGQEAAALSRAAPRRELDEALAQSDAGPAGSPRGGRLLYELFESQVVSRHLDLTARELRRQERGYYTISSSGHEPNVVLGRFVRHTDPAFLHYRSGALMAERARQGGAQTFIRDTLLSFMASSRDPLAGGRHKVWGSVELCVPPQTSTIASQLPRSVGAALSFGRMRRQGLKPALGRFGELPLDSIILCTFGDASVNHSAAQGAFNLACYAAHRNLPCPILFVCEDNGIGISVETAAGWIAAAFGARPGLRFFEVDGRDLPAACDATEEAVRFVRATRRPAFLRLQVVRLLGHAGSDVETEYHTLEEIAAAEARDPLLATARRMIEAGFLTPEETLALYEATGRRVADELAELGQPPLLTSAAQVLAPLAPYSPARVSAEARRRADDEARLRAFALDGIPGFVKHGDRARLPENQPPRHMAALINWALHDLMAKYPEMQVFGEDVAKKGGVYHVTAGLTARFGVGRVFNTLLDETSILGMAIGAGHLGLLPVPEIQYLAYVHNAIDQLRGEACSTQFFSNDQFRNPLVLRVASLAYQKGFGGHFHNDNSIAALRDIPGLVLACPSRGDDAARMLRTCLALAKIDGRVVAFLEPIALYMTKDLHEPGDGAWLCGYPPPDEAIALGEGRVYEPEAAEADGQGAAANDPGSSADDLTILTFGNGVLMSLQAARVLLRERGVRARVVDLRWLSPLNEPFIRAQAAATGRVLIVDEGRRSGGVSEAIAAILLAREAGAGLPEQDSGAVLPQRESGRVSVRRLTGADTYIPLGPAANLVLPTAADIVREALALAAVSTKGDRACAAASVESHRGA